VHGVRRRHYPPTEVSPKVTSYEVRVEADQAERPPQVFTAVRIHHVVTGFELDVAALEEAIRLSEEKYCSVGAMVQKTASFHTTYEIVEDKTEWVKPTQTAGVQG
jgi:putative redox protein